MVQRRMLVRRRLRKKRRLFTGVGRVFSGHDCGCNLGGEGAGTSSVLDNENLGRWAGARSVAVSMSIVVI